LTRQEKNQKIKAEKKKRSDEPDYSFYR